MNAPDDSIEGAFREYLDATFDGKQSERTRTFLRRFFFAGAVRMFQRLAIEIPEDPDCDVGAAITAIDGEIRQFLDELEAIERLKGGGPCR